MARRIILSCWGSYGDLFPYLALARGLAARGVTPIVATRPYYRERVEAEGFGFLALEPDLDPSDRALIARVMDPAKGSAVIVRELVMPHVRTTFAAIREATRAADLVVTHPLTFASRLAAEAERRPWISTVLAPAGFFSTHDFPVFAPYPGLVRLARIAPVVARGFLTVARRATTAWTQDLARLRTELELPPVPAPLFEGQFSPFGTLALFSRVLAGPQRDWPPRTTLTGFPFYDERTTMTPSLEAFLNAGEPPVVFTLGSSAVGAAGTFYQESLDAVARLGCRAVLLVGRNPDNRPRTELPASVAAAEYAPHAALFPRAAAIVHHGGVGTTAQALRAGRPTLIVPHAHDQHDNARRAAALGVSRTIDARRYRGPAVAHALSALLGTPTCRARAREVGAAVSAERGVDAACEALQDALGGTC
jgi:UDP:flavonoid glycosyltransferase YjiC (YdhE family)